MLDIDGVMQSLAARRPIFHLEADFQFALASHIKELMPDCEVRLEYPPFPGQRKYVDIWLPTIRTVIELKYRTLELDTCWQGERFLLTGQGIGRRYESVEDIARVEKMVKEREPIRHGFAVLLTNAAGYWNCPTENWKSTTDAAFRIHETRTLCGELKWSDNASEETKRGREEPIVLRCSYTLRWKDYSKLGNGNNSRFRYLAVSVGD